MYNRDVFIKVDDEYKEIKPSYIVKPITNLSDGLYQVSHYIIKDLDIIIDISNLFDYKYYIKK